MSLIPSHNLKSKFAIYILARDLTFDLPRSAPISVAYMILDVLFVRILPFDFLFYPCQFVNWCSQWSGSALMVSATSVTDNCGGRRIVRKEHGM